MWKKTRLLSTLLISACLFSLSQSVGICSQSQMYQISETELTTLQNHLDALEANNETLKAILSESGEELTKALDALTESRKELNALKIQLKQAKSETQSAQESLKIANDELAKAAQSFKQYEKERDKIEGRLRNQRNIWEVLCLVAVGVAVTR